MQRRSGFQLLVIVSLFRVARGERSTASIYSRALMLVALLVFPLFLQSCDESQNPVTQNVTCATGIVHIEVLDGAMIRVCGCTEPGNVTFTSSQALNCTVSKGATVFFDFVSISVNHQVNITSINATPVMAPNKLDPIQIFPIKLDTLGTFQFYDIFFPSIGGNITVQ